MKHQSTGAGHLNYAYHWVRSTVSCLCQERLGRDTAGQNRYLDFLDILLTAKDSDGQGLTDQEIRDETDTFLFEGQTQCVFESIRVFMQRIF